MVHEVHEGSERPSAIFIRVEDRVDSSNETTALFKEMIDDAMLGSTGEEPVV